MFKYGVILLKCKLQVRTMTGFQTVYFMGPGNKSNGLLTVFFPCDISIYHQQCLKSMHSGQCFDSIWGDISAGWLSVWLRVLGKMFKFTAGSLPPAIVATTLFTVKSRSPAIHSNKPNKKKENFFN